MEFFDIRADLQDSTRPGRDFDRLSYSRLRQCSSLSQVHAYLSNNDAEYHRVKSEPHHPAYDSYRLVSQLTRQTIPLYLTDEKEIKRRISGFGAFPRTQVRLFVLQCGGRHFKVDYEDGCAIFIDRNIVVRDALFFQSLYFAFPSGSPWMAGYIAQFAALYSSQPIPFQDELLWYAMNKDGERLVGTLAKLTHLIALHEIGHVYSNACGAEHPDFILRNLQTPLSEGDAMNWAVSVPPFLPAPSGLISKPHQLQVGDFFLLDEHRKYHFVPHGCEIQCDELFCDFYAWYNMVVLSQTSENSPVARLCDDDQLDWLLTIVASSLFLQELDQQSKNGLSPDALPELITLNPWKTRSTSHPHPRGLLRWQSLAIHSCTLDGTAPWARSYLEASFKLGFALFRSDNFTLARLAAGLHMTGTTASGSWNHDSCEKFIARQGKGQDRWRNLSAEMGHLTWHTYGAALFEDEKMPITATGDPLSVPSSVQAVMLLVKALENARCNEPVWFEEFSEALIDFYRVNTTC